MVNAIVNMGRNITLIAQSLSNYTFGNVLSITGMANVVTVITIRAAMIADATIKCVIAWEFWSL